MGLPVFTSEQVPAAREIGGEDVAAFSPDAGPEEVSALIQDRLERSPTQRLRRRVRQQLTWGSIFRRQVLGLLNGEEGGEAPRPAAPEKSQGQGTQAGKDGEEGRK